MSEESVKINVQSSSDPAAIDEILKMLDKLEEKGKAAGTGAMDAGKGLGIVGQAAGAASGNLASISGLLAGLESKFPKFASGALMAGGALAAWVDAIKKINDALANQGKNLRDIQAGNFANDVKRLKESYDELTASIDKAAKATSDLAAVEDEKRAADRAAEDAAIDLAEQQALADVAPGDDIGRRRVEADYAARRAAVGASRQGEDSQAKADSLRAQAETERARAAAADEQSKALYGAAGKAQSQASGLLGTQQRAMDSAWTPAGVARMHERWQPEVERATKQAADLLAESKKQKEAAEEARASAALLDRRASIAAQGVGVAGVRGRVGDAAAAGERAEIDRDAADLAAKARARSEAAAKADRLRAQLGEVEGSVAAARQRAAFEGADVDRAQAALDAAEATPGKSGRAAKNRELEALRKALAREQQEAREAIAAAAQIIEDAAKSTKDLQQRLRQAESRSKASSSDSGQGD